MICGKYYTGIGSRNTPEDIQEIFFAVGYVFASMGKILRSGGAKGADTAFQNGVATYAEENDVRLDRVQEIFLPWGDQRFNGLDVCPEKGIYHHEHDIANELTRELHPRPDMLNSHTFSLQRRNVFQILGKVKDGEMPDISSMVICWTPDRATRFTTPETGGTGQAIRLAVKFGVPVFNLADPTHKNIIERALEEVCDADI